MKMFALLPVAMMMFVGALTLYWMNFSQSIIPPSASIQATENGQIFLSYRDAVLTYSTKVPAFTGSVPASTLQAQGYVFPGSFLAVAGNTIAATGINGRVITCYATLPSGTIASALQISNNDISLGVASGGKWTSSAQGALSYAAIPLDPSVAPAVPNSAVVSVVQTGV